MNHEELVKRAENEVRRMLRGSISVESIRIHGIKIVGVKRDIFKCITCFEFENGWVIPIQVDGYYRQRGPDAVFRALVREVENWLQFLDPMELQAFRATEVLIDEDPEELDPFPVFVCQCCRSDYGQ